MSEEYRILASRALFDHPWVRIVVDTLEHAGRSTPYFYLESPVDAVATLAITPQGQAVLTRQYRHPVRAVIYDLPAGRLEPGEAPLDGARRELEEETGYRAGRILPLGRYNQFPGTLKAATELFFADDLTPAAQHLDEGEELEVVLLPFAEVLENVLSGVYVDGSLQMAVLMAAQRQLVGLNHSA